MNQARGFPPPRKPHPEHLADEPLTTRTVVASYDFRVSTSTPSQSKAATSVLRNALSEPLRIQAGPCSVPMWVYLVVISRRSPAVLPGAACSSCESPRLSG